MASITFANLAVPVWDSKVTQQVLTFGSASWAALTIPSAATGVLISSLETGGNEFWVSPVETDPSGIRIGGTSSTHLMLRLGDSNNTSVIKVYGNAGSSEKAGAIYFYGNPPDGGCREPVDLPVWDADILNREFSTIAAGATSEVFVPPYHTWFSLSVLETGGTNEAYVSTADSDDTGVRIGGNRGTPLIQRYMTNVMRKGTATSADAGGDDLIDANADFTALGVAVGDFIWNETDNSFGRVTGIDSSTQLSHTTLVHGSENDWDVDEVYHIYRGPSIFVHNPHGSNAIDVGALFFKR
jgi:hypothetical protein